MPLGVIETFFFGDSFLFPSGGTKKVQTGVLFLLGLWICTALKRVFGEAVYPSYYLLQIVVCYF